MPIRLILVFGCALPLSFALACSRGHTPAAGGAIGSPTSAHSTPNPVPTAELRPEKLGREAHPDLRTVTALVTPTQPEVIRSLPTSLGRRYPKLGPDWATVAQQSFGSGAIFIRDVIGSGNRIFVVTNQHVLSFAEEAEIRVPKLSLQHQSRLRHLDDQYDLAVLELLDVPPGELHGFTVTSHLLRDQDEVVAAGYPGIGGDPSYQVTRGYVSNERIVIDESGHLPFIQHTASIDPGSSGGPLTEPSGALVGINTLKVRHREGAGLAIPGEAVLRALEKATHPGAPESLEHTCTRLAALLSLGEPSAELPGLLRSCPTFRSRARGAPAC
jgi:S1-C subfamily serine protease